ncbi:hypothetical protein Semix9P1_phi29 [Clostridioides phage phiSemix9P1]|uniref:hypothetical protein n=1 Tax=unclassified Clostridioides TaxID=2635829 RepID=UPI0009C24908|nr:hypothetical protein Semix9P1_phi29 [Clostridioides phage phiSemix9P1]MCC0646196.1 hypothetical protein [Clostridioides sp. ZZV14-6150]MCC0704886.1 hypothetical protein [Clostridioides sp. ES-S-0049-02]MCC0724014.1 hypothetical protein [Clostridioides sp. ZZV14-6104]MCC0724851.1 hypothetical protein [Clostridioides sp. ZZV14-6045]MCC0732297.1 hypothetical protein [Clostridioides sp. ZZV14-6048]MCC0736434.1 hypothetical protein [Clostridioides sp. ZZV14-6009]MCC0740157.1 hypothetical prote
MIFLGNLSNTNYIDVKKVGLINYTPSDLSSEELKQGILVDNIMQEELREGYYSTLYVNTLTKETHYKYELIVKSKEELEKENLINKVNSTEQTIADLTFQLMSNGVI